MPISVSTIKIAMLTGYIAALLFGAVLTTFNAGLNSASTLFVLNLYKPYQARRNRYVSEARIISVGKRFELAACFFAMCAAPFIIFAKHGFYTYLQMVGGFFSVPIFSILFIGMTTKRVPPIAAKIGLLFFIVCYACTQLVFNIGLHFLHILFIIFILTLALMLLIGKMYPMSMPYQSKLNNIVDIKPWKNRHIYSFILIVLMILMFVIFSPVGVVK